MKCPACGGNSSVLETRAINENSRRRRSCNDKNCRHRFTTIEVVVQSSTNHSDMVIIALPKHEVDELRAGLGLLDRGIARGLSLPDEEPPT